MGQFGASIQTANYSNWLTQIDQYNASLLTYPLPNGQMNPLGSDYYDNTPASEATAQTGIGRKLRYVRYLSTANPTPTNVAGPFPVYWVDAAQTTVTPVVSESFSATNASIAGLAGPNPISLGISAAATATALNGNFIWICVQGYVVGAGIGVTAQAAGASIYGAAATNFTLAFTIANTAPPYRVLGWATAAVGATPTFLTNLLVTLES